MLSVSRLAFASVDRGEAGASIPDPMCVPIRYRPIALLMRRNNAVDLHTTHDMSADRCGCR